MVKAIISVALANNFTEGDMNRTLRFILIAVIIVIVFACSKEPQKEPQPKGIEVRVAEKSGDVDISITELQRLYEYMDVKEGLSVGDIGCGEGRFTFALAKTVGPKGKVYALDINQERLDELKGQMGDKELYPYDNIVVLKNRMDDTLLPPATLDRATLVNVHFHNDANLREENIAMIRSVYKTIKPGGRLVIIDSANYSGPEDTWILVNAAKNTAKNYMDAGFKLEKGPDIYGYLGRFIISFTR